VACPYFWPEGKLETGPWTHTPRLPLGDAFSGSCRAQPGEVHRPTEQRQEELCNCGYSRGVCERFPTDSPADAVRFSIASDKPARLRLTYVYEKDHAPAKFGVMEFLVGTHAFLDRPADELLARQAEAFVESYLALTRASSSDTQRTTRAARGAT